MEKLQGPINPCLLGELELGCLEEENGELGMGMSYGQLVSSFEDTHYTLPSLEDKMPFLQMLQGFEPYNNQDQPFFPLMQESNFQLLLRLQHQQVMMKPLFDHNQSFIELESCVTNNNDVMVMDLHSPAAKSPVERREKLEIQNSTMAAHVDNVISPKVRSKRNQTSAKLSSVPAPKEKRKRKRSSRPSKNKEEVESQRMTHIAVERNRRRQMNEHLNALRSLMPPSYVQRGDQASIVGGAIDFVKELEQLLQSLQAQKRMRQQSEEKGDVVSASSSTSSSSNLLDNLFMAPPSSSSPPLLQFRYPHSHSHSHSHSNEEGNGNSVNGGKGNEEFSAEKRSALADIDVVIIQNHVNLKIQCQRRPGQLLKAIVALEQLRLSVLHLNITSFHSFVHYSFNLKIEEDCKLGSADEVASAVHQIFRLISIS